MEHKFSDFIAQNMIVTTVSPRRILNFYYHGVVCNRKEKVNPFVIQL